MRSELWKLAGIQENTPVFEAIDIESVLAAISKLQQFGQSQIVLVKSQNRLFWAPIEEG
jgi:hypothetical protein